MKLITKFKSGGPVRKGLNGLITEMFGEDVAALVNAGRKYFEEPARRKTKISDIDPNAGHLRHTLNALGAYYAPWEISNTEPIQSEEERLEIDANPKRTTPKQNVPIHNVKKRTDSPKNYNPIARTRFNMPELTQEDIEAAINSRYDGESIFPTDRPIGFVSTREATPYWEGTPIIELDYRGLPTERIEPITMRSILKQRSTHPMLKRKFNH